MSYAGLQTDAVLWRVQHSGGYLEWEQISCIIPGFRNTEQVKENLLRLGNAGIFRRGEATLSESFTG